MGKTGNCLLRLFCGFLAFITGSVTISLWIIGGYFLISCLFLLLTIVFICYVAGLSKKKNDSEGLSLKDSLFMPMGQVMNIDSGLANKVVDACKNHSDLTEIKKTISGMSEMQKRDTLVYAFRLLVKQFLEEGVLSEEEGIHVVSFFSDLELDSSYLKKEKEYVDMCKLIVINCVLNGKMPTGVPVDLGGIFLNMEPDEQPIATQQGAIYNELVEKKTHYGISMGSSKSVGKGRYSHFGSFISTTELSQDIVEKGKGTLLLTNKNIYFVSGIKTTKLPYDKILSYSAYSDAVGIHLTDSRRRPIIICKIDGWFVYNIVTNVNNLNHLN